MEYRIELKWNEEDREWDLYNDNCYITSFRYDELTSLPGFVNDLIEDREDEQV